jgi:hypothetical protein
MASLTSEATQLIVHDPRGYPPKVTGKALAPRLERLDGKRVYLVDCLFDNSREFMIELEDWFSEHLPAVDARTITPRESWVDDPEMRNAIAHDGDAAILGVGL